MRIFGAERITGLMERLGMEEDVPIEHGLDQPRHRERAEEGRGAQLRHPQEPARVRRRHEPAAQDDLRAAPAGPRGALRARADRGGEEEGQDQDRRAAADRVGQAHRRVASPEMRAPDRWRACVDALDRAARVADADAPGGSPVTHGRRSIRPGSARAIYRQFGAYPDASGHRRGSHRRRSIAWPARSRSSLIQQRERLLDLSEEMIQLDHRRALSAQRARRGLGPRRAAAPRSRSASTSSPSIDEQGLLERETLAESLWGEVEKVIEAREAELPLPVFLLLRAPLLPRGDRRALDRAPEVDGGAARGHRPARLRPEGSQAGVQEGRLRHLRRDDEQHRPQRLREAVPHAAPARRGPVRRPRRARRRRRSRRRSMPPAAAPKPRKTIESGGGAERASQAAETAPARPSRCAAASPRSAATIPVPAEAVRNTRNATAPSPRRNRSQPPLP